MAEQHKAGRILQAMRQKAGFEALNVKEEPNRLRIMGRVPTGQTNRNTLNWLIVVYRLLKAADQVYRVDISKQYFIRNDKVVFGWRVVFEGDNLEKYYEFITNIVAESPQSASFELDEVVLPGANRDRNNTAGGRRGAMSALNPVVGAAAVMRKMQGG